jgi:pimeloyl-ACP methyl ester carboxylesterase
MRSRDPTPGSDQRRRPDAVIVGSVPRPPVAPRALLRTLGVWRTVRAAPSLLRPLLGKRRRRRCRQGIHLHFGIVSRAQEPRQDPRRLGWVGNDLPVGKRHGGAEVPVYLCHEGGTAEDASAVPCEEPAQCRYVVCGGVANGAGGVGVQGASFASEGHRTVMVRLDDASSKGARRSIADGKPTGLRRGARLRADQGALGVSRRGGFLGAVTAPIAARRAAARSAREARRSVVLLEGAGHYMQEDAADEIVTAIRDWRSPGGTPDASSAGRRLRSRDFPIGAVSAPPS